MLYRNYGDKNGSKSFQQQRKDVLQEIWMTFYESIANQGMQTYAVWMFIETSGECAIHFD